MWPGFIKAIYEAIIGAAGGPADGGNVTVLTTPTRLTSTAGYIGAYVEASSANTGPVRLGNANVTASLGVLLAAGERMNIEPKDGPPDKWYAIRDTGVTAALIVVPFKAVGT